MEYWEIRLEICGTFQFTENFVNWEISQNNNLHCESMETMVQWWFNHDFTIKKNIKD